MSPQEQGLAAGLQEEVQHYLPRPPTLVSWRERELCDGKPASQSWLCHSMAQKRHSSSLDFRFFIVTEERSYRPSRHFEA